jgi:hypothetical protein
MVSGTLMNLCDNPNRVSVFQVWRDSDLVQRVPIIVTGNDFSTLFAPLVRDGRMAKFYWEPDRVDLLAILHQMYKVGTRLGVQSRDKSTKCLEEMSERAIPLVCSWHGFRVGVLRHQVLRHQKSREIVEP